MDADQSRPAMLKHGGLLRVRAVSQLLEILQVHTGPAGHIDARIHSMGTVWV